MSEWLNFVKEYSLKNKIPYKQALKEASSSYKTRNDVKPEPKPEPKPEAKPDAQPADTKTEKSGKIRVTGEE